MVIKDYNITNDVIDSLNEDSIVSEPSIYGIKALLADNWYKAHPDKVLGVPYEASGKWGKVIKYKGTINDVERIEAPDNFIGNTKITNDPLASATFDINASAEILKPDVEKVVTAAIEGAEKEAKELSKKKRKKIDENAIVRPVGEIKSFMDTFNETKGNITLDEVEVYVWYKSFSGKPLSKYYVSIFKPELFSEDEDMTETYNYTVPDAKIAEWVNAGLLFYYGGKLLPAVEYLQGNIYDKKMKLDAEAEYIKTTYGEDVYNKQVATLQATYDKVYQRRLTIGSGERSLVLLAISTFAKEFKVENIVSNAELERDKFKIKASGRAEDKGQPDFLGDKTLGNNTWDDSKRKVYDELSLVDAFKWWMFNKNPDLKEPVSHLEIIQYYVEGKNLPKLRDKDSKTEQEIKDHQAKNEKLKSLTQKEGERLFNVFLETELLAADKVRLETIWNVNNNNYIEPDYNLIPLGFRMMKNEVIKIEKRDAVAFTLNNGTGILAYDVGVGKTPSAIFTMSAFIDAGYCKRPLVVVPNQVYKQFISEIRMFTPHIPVNEAYNLSKDYAENFQNNEGKITPPPKGTITVMTYDGFRNMVFTDETRDSMIDELYEILNQGGESEKTEKGKASFREKIETMVGRGIKGGKYPIEDFGFDFICYDEAHKMKKVFTSVKGEVEDDGKGGKERGKNPYVITSGTPSTVALRGFMINQYILRQNGYKNVMMLTATPFTNSPLEIFSMLSMVAYETLLQTDMNNIKSFFDTYVQARTELVINSKLKPTFKQVFLGFNNLISLQVLVRRFILHKTGDEAKVPRPKKYVLPYIKDIQDDVVVLLPEDKKVETYISMTDKQKAMMDDIIRYVEGGNDLLDIELDEDEEEDMGEEVDVVEGDDEEGETKKEKKTTDVLVDEESLTEEEKIGVRTIKGLNFSRNLALSPYLYKFSGMTNPTYKEYVETSPKLMYVMGAVKSVKEYHESRNEPVSGQVIYMDRGIQYFDLLKEYLVKEIGFKPHEVGIIKSGLPKDGEKSKEYVKNLFNGEIYNEVTQKFQDVPHEKRIKVVIGSSTIKEGINLQKFGTVLYNCFLDWNPTDIQQVEGRIYRQKNNYNAVRIVNPLVIDSADIFIFQKLQEKTARLNSIWSRDGNTNVLNTAEFSPEELKYALIRDPEVITELKIIQQEAEIDSKKIGVNRQLVQAWGVISSARTVRYNFNNLVKSIEKYRNFEPTGDLLADALKLVKIVNDLYKNQTDKDGKKIYASWDKKYLKPKELEAASPLDSKYSKPYYFTDFAVNARELRKFKERYLDALNISIDYNDAENSIKWFIDNLNSEIEALDEEKKRLRSPEYMEMLLAQVVEEKERNQVNYVPLQESIQNFTRLNYLLADQRVPVRFDTAPKYSTCPPLNADGTRAIDKDAIDYLEKCLDAQPQTKSKHYNEETGYTLGRRKLHDKIIKNLFESVRCVTKGQPIAIFTGGSPASGKSTFIAKNAEYLRSDRIFHLDADEIRAKLPEYEGWNANSTHEETQDIVNSLLEKLGDGQCRYDFIYDGTMNKAKKYHPLIQKVKDMGYKTYIIFMDIPYEEAKRRALNRYQETGRFVPMQVIDDFFTEINGKSRGQMALDELKDMVDGYVVADGFTGEIKETGGEGIPRERSEEVYGDRFKPVMTKAAEPKVEQKTEVKMPEKAPKDSMTTERAKSIFELFEANQDDNLHSENAVLLATNFGTDEQIRDAKKILQTHDKVGSLSDSLRQRRDVIVRELYPKLLEAAKVERKVEKVEKKMDKAFIQKLLNGLEIALKYATGNNKEQIQKQINSLNIALKYS